MNTPFNTRRPGLILSGMVWALLTACGGGDSGENPADEKVPLARPMAAPTVCGLTPLAQTGPEVVLYVPMKDLRNATHDGYPTAETTDSMGVEMGSALEPGSVDCETGVGRLFDANELHLASWTSERLIDLPLEQLSGVVVNGFEFTHNFATTEATAVFRMNKSTLADTAASAICHIGFSGDVDCSPPYVRESSDGLQWELRRPMTAPGVYMLTANRERLS